jgi:hypothetical protein
MKRKEYIDGLRSASTVEELETAIQAPYHRSWRMILGIIRERAERLCASHPDSRFIPLRKGNQLEICGESHSCGRGGGYYGYGAEEVVKGALRRNGLSQTAAYRIWEWAAGPYLHRCIPIIADARAGKLSDPPMNRLIFAGMSCCGPINMSVEANAADDISSRATLPCGCGGTLFDWGSGYSDGFNFVSWRCNKCPRTYSEWVTDERFREIRQWKSVVMS